MVHITSLVIFFYQGTVSAVKFRKRLAKFKITIVLPKKFGSKNFITAVNDTKIWRSSGESNEICIPYMTYAGDIAIQKSKINFIKIKIVPFIIYFELALFNWSSVV